MRARIQARRLSTWRLYRIQGFSRRQAAAYMGAAAAHNARRLVRTMAARAALEAAGLVLAVVWFGLACLAGAGILQTLTQ